MYFMPLLCIPGKLFKSLFAFCLQHSECKDKVASIKVLTKLGEIQHRNLTLISKKSFGLDQDTGQSSKYQKTGFIISALNNAATFCAVRKEAGQADLM